MRRLMSSGGDRGAAAIVFALTITLLVGAVGMAIDIGAGYAKRQEFQNSADAAALAVARECLLSKQANDCVGGVGVAGDYATANAEGIESVELEYPRPYSVTTKASGSRDNFFISVLGGDFSQMEITTSATAEFGSPVSGTSVLPVVGAECVFPGGSSGPPFGSVVEFWFSKNGDVQEAAGCEGVSYPAGGFGWLTPESGCTAASELGEDVYLGKPGNSITSTCKDKKHFSELAKNNTTVLIPLFGESDGGGAGGYYEISKYAAFELTAFESGTGAFSSYGKCAGPKPGWAGNGASGYCFAGKFREVMEDSRDFELGPVGGITFIRLINPKDL